MLIDMTALPQGIKPHVSCNKPGTAQKHRIRERDGYTCQLCGIRKDPDLSVKESQRITIDHFIPRSLGGRNTKANLYCACYQCNQVKADIFFKTFQEAQIYVLLKRNMLKKLRILGYDMTKI